MLPEETDRTSDSSTENEQDNATPPRKEDVNPERSLESLKAENQRKSEKIQNLEKKLESYGSRLAELESLAEERNLTKQERNEVSDLKDDIRTAARKLRDQEESKPWVKIAEEEAETKAFEAATNIEIMRANDFIDDKAFELGITSEELVEKLRTHADTKPGQSLYRRNVEAFRAWQKEQTRLKSIEEREAKLKEREDAETRFRETGTRLPRNTGQDRKWEEARTPTERAGLLVDLMDENPGPVSRPK